MRYAVLSDIHSNLEALEAVLAHAREKASDEFVCLGDIVGYNADPNECLRLIRELECPVVKGNHDEQAAMTASTEGFNEMAEAAIGWTREQLSADEKGWLADLGLTKLVRDFTIVHASLDAPEHWGYVFNDLDAMASFTYQHTPLCFFGHTHWPTAFVRNDVVHHLPAGQIDLARERKFLINPGSIGQPRDRDWRAAYCIYDTTRNVVEPHRVEYDLAKAQQKIRKAGLPQRLADRLAWGR
jgi:predicted phosphodiesterase